MRSGTSLFNWTVFKKTICRFWPLWGVYSAIWLLILPLNGVMYLRREAYNHYGYFYSYVEDYARVMVPERTDTALMLAVVFGALAAMAAFSHLYSARSANLFGSLPIRREGLFLTHYLAGLCFLIVPNGAIFLLTLAVELAGGCVYMPGLLFWLAVSCGECFLFYSMAVFCAMFTGHILALPAFYAILNGIAAGITCLVQLLLSALCYGFCYLEMPGIVVWLTPAANLGQEVQFLVHESEAGEWAAEAQGLGAVGVYALAALALTACAFFLYRARRLECAGDVVAVSRMKPVFRYGVAFCAGLALGMLTIAFAGGGEILLMISTVAWGAAGYFAAEMLLQKSFRVFKKWKGAAVVAGVFALLFLVVGSDLTGFETRIPDPASVASVKANGLNAVYLQDSGDSFNDRTVTDPEVIKLLGILHREAVEQRDGGGQARTGSVSISLRLTYTLQGGGTLVRQYFMRLDPDEADQEGSAAWALQQIYDNHELYWQMYGFAQLEEALAGGGRLEHASHVAYDEETGAQAEAVFYGADAQALLAAVKEDFFAGRIGVRQVGAADTQWDYESLDFFVSSTEYDGYRDISITLQDTASSTLAVLEELLSGL